MIRCYIPVDQRNKKRIWPCKSASGIVITVPCDRVTMTREDLGAHVRSGLLIELESIQEPDIDQPVAAFSEDAPLPVSDVIEAPVVAPVAEIEQPPVADTVIVSEVTEGVEVAAEAEAEAQVGAESGFDAMTRSELWALIVDKSLDAGNEYRSTTKSKMISILTAEG